MPRTYALLMAAIFGLLAGCGGGNDVADNTACGCAPDGGTGNVRLEGDSIYNAKLVIELPVSIAHSSPRGIVESYTGISRLNGDPELQKQGRALDKKFKAMRRSELERLEALLLTEDQQQAVKDDRAEDESAPDLYDSETSAPEITNETKQDDGSVMFELKSIRTTRKRDSEEAEWEEETTERFKRVYCIEEDGKWYVDRVETRRKDYANSTEEETKWKWEEESNSAVTMYYRMKKQPMDKDRPTQAPTIKTGTPEQAAQSFMNLADMRMNTQMFGLGDVLMFMAENYAPVYSKRAHEDAKEQAKTSGEFDDGKPTMGEVIKLSDTETEVKFEVPLYGGTTKTVGVRVRKVGNKWQVYETGRHRSSHTTNELEYQKNEKVYNML